MKTVQHVATVSHSEGTFLVHYFKDGAVFARTSYTDLTVDDTYDRIIRDIKDFTGMEFNMSVNEPSYKLIELYAV